MDITDIDLRAVDEGAWPGFYRQVLDEQYRRDILASAPARIAQVQQELLEARDGRFVTSFDAGDAPAWIAPTGVHDAYPVGVVVAHEGRLWQSQVPSNTAAPGSGEWRAES